MRPCSVVIGKDKDVIPLIMDIHAKPGKILDCTYNCGKMWKGTGYAPVRMDIDPSFDLDVVGDFTKMPFEDESFEVIAYDPPHLPTNAASKNSSKMWERRYGINATDERRMGDDVSPLFVPFLKEAKRVLVKDGIVMAKIADLVHNHHYQWQHVSFILAAREVGLTPCDVIIKIDPCAGNLKSSKWKNVKHFRKNHCYWMVVRKGKCEKPS